MASTSPPANAAPTATSGRSTAMSGRPWGLGRPEAVLASAGSTGDDRPETGGNVGAGAGAGATDGLSDNAAGGLAGDGGAGTGLVPEEVSDPGPASRASGF
jgi:hypothetical protein